ncbi:MAG: glycosyltransferase family 39 protein [Chitinophagales bacterium]
MKFKITSKQVLLFCICFLIASNFFYRVVGKRMMQTITWDVFGYYLYLPALFYDNLAQLNHVDSLLIKYNPTGSFYQAWKAPNGNYVMKYSCGQAVMYLPAFAVAHVSAKVFGYAVDGMSFPYQAAVNFESVIVGCIGLWLLRKILRKYFDDRAVAFTLLIFALASNYYQYVAFDNPFQHVYLFSLYCIIILLSIKWNEKPSYGTSIALGFCCGLAALTRPTEVITAFIPLLWGVHDRISLRGRIKTLTLHFKKIISFILAACAIGSFQLIYWKVYTGHFFYYSYGEDQTFSWLHPHVWNVLASYQKGWLIYTPVMVLSLIGFIPLFMRRREIFWHILLYMLLFFYLISAWDNWKYGGSFSMRAMIQSYPLLAFPVSAFIDWGSKSKLFTVITCAFTAACIWLNGIMSYQAYFSPVGIYDGDFMNVKYYWCVFGKTHINVNDRKFLDTNEELPEKLTYSLAQIYFNDLENTTLPVDTSTAFSGRHSMIMNDSLQWTPSIEIPVNSNERCWYRASANVYFPAMEWNVWKQPQICIALANGSQQIKVKQFRVARINEPGSWQQVFIDINGVIPQPYDRLKFYFWNPGSEKQIYIDDLKIMKACE